MTRKRKRIEVVDRESVMTEREAALTEALRAALPYVQRIAATAPTEPSRMQRQRDASKLATKITDLMKE